MKLITNHNELEAEFLRLLKQYDSYYWVTAWAGVYTKAFDQLRLSAPNIKKIAVGIHFYQTHPKFIETFLANEQVRYILQADGTFHPKLYLFANSSIDWELLAGSPNFTNGAFTRNEEASVLISKDDNNSKKIYKQAKDYISTLWSKGELFTEEKYGRYLAAWEMRQPKIKSLSGRYGETKEKFKPALDTLLTSMTWNEFADLVVDDKTHGVHRRLKVIEIANNLFSTVQHFNQMHEEERKFIAGMPNKLSIEGAEYWGYFGSMQGAGIFKNKVISKDTNLSKALDQIPGSGKIKKKHYESFVSCYTKVFLNTHLEKANNISTASRLLMMKRPDVFVCYDAQNKSGLCRDFGILQRDMNYERYWDDIIERIYDSQWWQHPPPRNEVERRIWNARAAFLDTLYYKQSR